MPDPNTAVPGPPDLPRTPDGLPEAWGANLKLLFKSELENMDGTFDKYEYQTLKLFADHQQALALHEFNIVSQAKLASDTVLVTLGNTYTNANQQQASQSNLTIDDVGKVMQTATQQLSAIFTTQLQSLQALLVAQQNAQTAQLMAILIALTGRPPVTAPAVAGPATDLGGK